MAIHYSNLAWRIPWTEEPGTLPLLCLERDSELPVALQEEASLTLKLKRTPHGLCHILKDTDFPVHSR